MLGILFWHEQPDTYGRVVYVANSAVVPGEGEVGFEWWVTRKGVAWTVKRSDYELIGGFPVEALTFSSADDAKAWCQERETAILDGLREQRS